jgi:hypothetical protein
VWAVVAAVSPGSLFKNANEKGGGIRVVKGVNLIKAHNETLVRLIYTNQKFFKCK